MTYYTEVAADSPVDFYKMETGTGTDDGSGGRTLTLSNVTTGVAGIVGNAWSFNGTNSSASMATYPGGASVANLTYEGWIKAPSNGGMTSGDYNTVLRRNGTDIILLRIRGSSITGGVNPGKAEAYVAGTTLLSAGRVDDGLWHYVALTVSGTSAKLYVDNAAAVTATTSKSTYNLGTAAAYIGSDSGTAEFFKGTLDNVAIYSTALSSTRIAAHYAAGVVIDASYTQTAATASALMVAPTFSNVTNAGYTATAMTASATSPDAVGQGNVIDVVSTADTYVNGSSTGTNYGSATSASIYNSSNLTSFFKFPDYSGSDVVTKTELLLTQTAGGTGSTTFLIYTADASWSESTLTYANKPSVTFFKVVTVTVSAGTRFTLDLTGINAPNGIVINSSTTNLSVGSKENATSSSRPTLRYTTAPVANVSFTASAMAASAGMPDPVISTTHTVSVSGGPMTATADMVAPVVTITGNLTMAPEPAQAFAEMADATFSIPVTVSATAMTASAELVNPSAGVEVGVRFEADSMNANARIVAPALVNGHVPTLNEADDNYFLRVRSLVPKIWFRLNEPAGATSVYDRGNGSTAAPGLANAAWDDVQFGLNNAPEGRGSAYFNGAASINQSEVGGEQMFYSGNYPATTLEFSIRTTKQNQFVLISRDAARSTRAGTAGGTDTNPIEVVIKNGKVTYRSYNWIFQEGRLGSITEFSGFKNVADGEWHTINIRSNQPRFNESVNQGLEIWIDGKLDVRRRSVSAILGFPDFIGGRPDSIEGLAITPLATSQWFVGDMSEVVFYDHLISDDQVPRLYYDFMGWKPIEVAPAEAFAFMTDGNKGRGNQKRALYLWWSPVQDFYSVGGDREGEFNKMNMDPVLEGKGNFGIYDLAGYKVFSKGVTRTADGAGYRDEVTDEGRFIDLEKDLDIDEFDVIMFGDWPDEGSEVDSYEYFYPGERERLVQQLRWANNRGVGLLVTQYRMAVDLGIVDRVEFAETLVEYSNASLGNAVNLYDYGAAVKFPWNISSSSAMEGGSGAGSGYNGQAMNTNPTFLSDKAFFYADENFNNRFRVRALIDGLTDIPSYMITDAISQIDYDPWGWQISAFKYLHRMNGLQIGDEFIFHGNNPGGTDWSSADMNGYRLGRPKGTYAVPPGHVLAGTVVTTFGAKVWIGKQEIDNPYKDYATTIVLRPGDTLAGQPVGGRIFVNFTEQPNRFSGGVPVQKFPASTNKADWPANYANPDTAAQREWEWSDTRKTVSSTATPQTNPIVGVVLPSGELQTFRIGGLRNNLTMGRSAEIFPIEWFPSLDMVYRGMFWLAEKVQGISENDAIVVAAPMTATAAAVQPRVVAQRSVVVHVTPMVALAEALKVAEDHSGNVDIYTLPMTAEAMMTGYGKVIHIEPMTATAEMVENFNMIHATGEQVVLTLHGVDATLYLKEEA